MPSPISFIEFAGTVAGVGFVIGVNVFAKKPAWTGIYKHAAAAAVGYFTGQQLERMNTEAGRRKLIMLEDYVRLHPEDFEEEAPKTYGDILMKWYPVR